MGYAAGMDANHDDKPRPAGDQDSEGQVSEVSSMAGAGEEISPGDAVAGAPDQSAGDDRAEEGTAGPDAPPRHGIPEESNESSR